MIYMCQVHCLRWRKERRCLSYKGENDTELDCVLVKIEHPQFLQNLMAVHEEFQLALVLADIDEKKIRNIV